jgi:hypothetical protein
MVERLRARHKSVRERKDNRNESRNPSLGPGSSRQTKDGVVVLSFRREANRSSGFEGKSLSRSQTSARGTAGTDDCMILHSWPTAAKWPYNMRTGQSDTVDDIGHRQPVDGRTLDTFLLRRSARLDSHRDNQSRNQRFGHRVGSAKEITGLPNDHVDQSAAFEAREAGGALARFFFTRTSFSCSTCA